MSESESGVIESNQRFDSSIIAGAEEGEATSEAADAVEGGEISAAVAAEDSRPGEEGASTGAVGAVETSEEAEGAVEEVCFQFKQRMDIQPLQVETTFTSEIIFRGQICTNFPF